MYLDSGMRCWSTVRVTETAMKECLGQLMAWEAATLPEDLGRLFSNLGASVIPAQADSPTPASSCCPDRSPTSFRGRLNDGCTKTQLVEEEIIVQKSPDRG